MGGSVQREGRLYGEISNAQTGTNVTCTDHGALPLDPDTTQLCSLKAGGRSCHHRSKN